MVTITIKGPQGVGKTMLARMIKDLIQKDAEAAGSRRAVAIVDVGIQSKAARKKTIAESFQQGCDTRTAKDTLIVVRQTC